MALEKQDQHITPSHQADSLGTVVTHADILNHTDDLYVSYYYIPEMSHSQDAKNIRTALLPFCELLAEHYIDLETHHLTLYHYAEIEPITQVLQQLYPNAALQQTLAHYEPIQQDDLDEVYSESLVYHHQKLSQYVKSIILFLFSLFSRLMKYFTQILNRKKTSQHQNKS